MAVTEAPVADAVEIDDDEILYRRVPESMGWYRPDNGVLMPEAFGPTKNDLSGLSVARAKFKSAAEAAKGRPGKRYFVAALHAGTLRAGGIAVEPRPLPSDPGHAELPDLNAVSRKEDRTLELERLLVTLVLRVEGPFGGHDA